MPIAPAGGGRAWLSQRRRRQMLAKTQDNEEIIERVAACDIGKAELVCCVRVPDADRPGRRLQEVETYSTMTRPLLGMADRLGCLGVTRVVMEATSDYWKPVFYLLEAAGFEPWLVNAKDVKHLPGRPKTDKLRSEEHTSELQSQSNLVCRLLLEKKKPTALVRTQISANVLWYSSDQDVGRVLV